MWMLTHPQKILSQFWAKFNEFLSKPENFPGKQQFSGGNFLVALFPISWFFTWKYATLGESKFIIFPHRVGCTFARSLSRIFTAIFWPALHTLHVLCPPPWQTCTQWCQCVQDLLGLGDKYLLTKDHFKDFEGKLFLLFLTRNFRRFTFVLSVSSPAKNVKNILMDQLALKEGAKLTNHCRYYSRNCNRNSLFWSIFHNLKDSKRITYFPIHH